MSANFARPLKKMNLSTVDVAKGILKIGEQICGIQLYPYQYTFAIAIITAVLERKGIHPTALFSRQCGKTETVAVVSIGCCVILPGLAKAFPDDPRVRIFMKGFFVGVYAPKEKQAKLAFARIRQYAHSDNAKAFYADKGVMLQVTKSRGDSVAWSNNAFVLASTASEYTDNEGETWHLLICDESQKLSTGKIKKELRPMLASTHGPFIQIGTATASKAYFFKTIESSVEREREDGIRRHFQTDYQGVISQRRHVYEDELSRFNAFSKMRPAQQKLALVADPKAGDQPDERHLAYEEFIGDELRELHGDVEDEMFKMNFRLLWADNRMIAIPDHIWESLAIPNLEMNLSGVKGYITAGLDVAKGDSENADQTVLTITITDVDHPVPDEKAIVAPGEEPPIHYIKTIIGLYTFRGDFEEVQYDGIIDALRLYPTLRYLVIDSTGMGDPVYARLRDLLPDIQVEGVSWASGKMKSDVYKRLLMECKAGRLRYAAGPETRTTREYDDMCDQVTGLEKKFIGQGNVMVCQAPEGDHDDYPDSIALAVYASHRSFEEEVPEAEEAETRNFGRNSHAPSGVAKRADSYRSGRRGRSRYDRAA